MANPTNEHVTEVIYHLALREPWDAACARGESYRRSTLHRSLEEEGFIHCSFRDQVEGVADRFYRGRTDVLLLRIDPSKVGAEVRVERPGGFPHIYGPLPVDAVVGVTPVACGDDARLLVGEHLG